MTLDELRLTRLKREINEIIYISLCGSVQGKRGIWVPPGNDYRAVYGLPVTVVYLSHQAERATNVMEIACRNRPYCEVVNWWCLDTGQSGMFTRDKKVILHNIFMDNTTLEVAEMLRADVA
jgi:hypothetical protein